jgi:hypothetical protein
LGNFPQKGVEYGQIGMAVASFCPSSHGIYVDVQMGGQVLRFIDVGCPLLYDQTGMEFGNS